MLEPPPPPGRTIVVQPGQTVWEISRASGISVEEIVEVNGLASANEIAAGQLLFLPAAPLAPSEAPPPSTPVPMPKPRPVLPGPVSEAGLIWPVDGVVLRDFGGPKSKPHLVYDGILIAAPAHTPVHAVAAGTVAFAGSQGTNLGTLVVIEHAGDLISVYGHLARTAVKEGQTVVQGEIIGEVGTSGLVGVSPRVQLQLRKDRLPVDPVPLLPP